MRQLQGACARSSSPSMSGSPAVGASQPIRPGPRAPPRRGGAAPAAAGRLADYARGKGLEVRGVMGYEGHVMLVADPAEKLRQTEECMTRLLKASADVGGDLVSASGTGNYALNTWANEIQAGSYLLMDTTY